MVLSRPQQLHALAKELRELIELVESLPPTSDLDALVRELSGYQKRLDAIIKAETRTVH
jgi:hypothetical protein